MEDKSGYSRRLLGPQQSTGWRNIRMEKGSHCHHVNFPEANVNGKHCKQTFVSPNPWHQTYSIEKTRNIESIMVISSSTGTHRRTAADEVVDQQETRQNYLDGRYHDWPNEAGVSDKTEAKPAKYGRAY